MNRRRLQTAHASTQKLVERHSNQDPNGLNNRKLKNERKRLLEGQRQKYAAKRDKRREYKNRKRNRASFLRMRWKRRLDVDGDPCINFWSKPHSGESEWEVCVRERENRAHFCIPRELEREHFKIKSSYPAVVA